MLHRPRGILLKNIIFDFTNNHAWASQWDLPQESLCSFSYSSYNFPFPISWKMMPMLILLDLCSINNCISIKLNYVLWRRILAINNYIPVKLNYVLWRRIPSLWHSTIRWSQSNNFLSCMCVDLLSLAEELSISFIPIY